MSEQQCATKGCDRPAMWIGVEEGNALGSAAPRRCKPCCKAIQEAFENLQKGERWEMGDREWTARELLGMASLDDVNGDELKISKPELRVWLCADGSTVQVERLVETPEEASSPRWRTVAKYPG
jgi:hypothetical protein